MPQADEHLRRARVALARGDVLIAYDEAVEATVTDPDDLEARYLVALALARSGARIRAAEEADRLQSAISGTQGVNPRLQEDIEALGARLARARALGAEGPARSQLAAEAAERYEEIGRRLDRYYSYVNAATLWLLSGDESRAQSAARVARALAAREPHEDTAGENYWRAATVAEASLVLGDVAAARAALFEAGLLSGADMAARSATRRQMALVCAELGLDETLLEPLQLPTVLHYCGHTAGPEGSGSRFPVASEPRITDAVERVLDKSRVGIAYGSLACGADIVVAEALLRRDVELNVLMPFDTVEFEQVSVLRGGAVWGDRFHRCLGKAASVVHASDSSYLGDDVLFGYASRIAMGHALNRAAYLGSKVFQLAITDGTPASEPMGTAHDVALWKRTGHETVVIDVPGSVHRSSTTVPRPMGRAIRALVFTDLAGFSRLRDEQYPAVLEGVIAPVARLFDGFGDAIETRKTWGDAIHVVCRDVVTAARAALAIQDIAQGLDMARLGLPEDLKMRVGAHVGPVLQWPDPIGGVPTWWGREMTRTARIEPRTPEGEVYVTDAFAALLALESPADVLCEYVGRVSTAKDFEIIPLYRLGRST